MDQTNIPLLISYVVGLAIFYGYTNARLKNLEERLKDHANLMDRLTRLEEKINLLLEYKIMNK